MPLYEYECVNCHHAWEELSSITQLNSPPCPICKSNSKKKFSPYGVVYNCKGFYSTDSSSNVKTETKDGKESKKTED
jgi:putative FmdB family regulatory protein